MIETAIVVVIKEGVVSESFAFRGDHDSVSVAAEAKLIELCEAHYGKPLDEDDKESILEDGYMETGETNLSQVRPETSSSICLHWLGYVTPVKKPLEVEEADTETFYATATVTVKIQCPKGSDHDDLASEIGSEADYEIEFADREGGVMIIDTEFESLEVK